MVSIIVTYHEGECWSAQEIPEFSLTGIAGHIDFNADEAEGAEELTVEHLEETSLTIVTYFNADGESRNWIAHTSQWKE